MFKKNAYSTTRRSVILVTVLCFLITCCFYGAHFKRSNVCSFQPEPSRINILRFSQIQTERNRTKMMAMKNLQIEFDSYWKTVHSLLAKDSNKEVDDEINSLWDGYRTLDTHFEAIIKYFDGEKVEEFQYKELQVSEFSMLTNLYKDIKYYWLQITSIVKRFNKTPDVQQSVNYGYIKLRKLLEEMLLDSRINSAAIMNKLKEFVSKKIYEIQNPYDCDKAQVYVCGLINEAGFGSELHTSMNCSLPAFHQERTFVFRTKGWKYDPEGWSHLFAPISTCDEISYPDNAQPRVVIGNPRCSSPIFHTAIPVELGSEIIKNHDNPFAWWSSQFVGYFMRLAPDFEQQLKNIETKLNFASPMVGIHIRRGDKILREAKKHEVEEYMFFVQIWFDQHEISERLVYVATDDGGVVQELKNKYPSYNFIKRSSDAHQRGVDALQGIVTDVYLLSKCDYVVCTATSNICRLTHELITYEHHDAFLRWQSVDDLQYYLGYELFEYVSINNHTTIRQEGEIGMIAGDHMRGYATRTWPHDGFIAGDNLRTKKEGKFPLYKIRPIQPLVKFSVLSSFNPTKTGN